MKKWISLGKHQVCFISIGRVKKRVEISLVPHFNIPLGKKRFLRIEGTVNIFNFVERPLSYFIGCMRDTEEERTDAEGVEA